MYPLFYLLFLFYVGKYNDNIILCQCFNLPNTVYLLLSNEQTLCLNL